MQGVSVSSDTHTIESAYPVLYDGLVCVPGGASNLVAADGNSDESHRAAGSIPLVSEIVTLLNKTTIAFIAC